MNNTLTAKERVNKLNKDENSQWSDYDCNYSIMEEYANYKNKMLEDKILRFRQTLLHLNEDSVHGHNRYYTFCLEEFDKHFNIK
jgi:hypothetical protein